MGFISKIIGSEDSSDGGGRSPFGFQYANETDDCDHETTRELRDGWPTIEYDPYDEEGYVIQSYRVVCTDCHKHLDITTEKLQRVVTEPIGEGTKN